MDVHKAGRKPQPWSRADATDIIRSIARGEHTLSITGHASGQMADRGLSSGDVLSVLKNGFVHEPAQESTRTKLYKYLVDGRSPNSGNRVVRVVVLPSINPPELKLITVMWRDEDTHRG
jgi:hypothetical protein